MKDTSGQGIIIQSVLRATQIVDCVAKSTDGIGVTAVAKEMGLGKSTVYGLLNTLVHQGYLEHNDQNKRYYLGIRLFELGMLTHKRMDLRKEAEPYLTQLYDRYRLTVNLASHSKGEVVIIDKIESPDSIVSYSSVGKRLPMYCTGVGKAILAFLSPDYLEEYLLNRPQSNWESPVIDDWDDLKASLQLIRQRGYAVDDEELAKGLVCVAAPIFDNTGDPVASASLSSFGKETMAEIEGMAPDVVEITRAISRRLGFQG